MSAAGVSGCVGCGGLEEVQLVGKEGELWDRWGRAGAGTGDAHLSFTQVCGTLGWPLLVHSKC